MKALEIVGGVYHEVIVVPEHTALLGSAGRAAVALGSKRAHITLHTVADKSAREQLESIAAANALSVDARVCADTLTFSYMHGLDVPRISPLPAVIARPERLNLAGAAILAYGAIDFDWAVEGNQVVYDPQNAFNPSSFAATGSKAGRLAIVLNEHEAIAITGQESQEAILSALFRIDQPEVIVLKCGARGTVVAHRNDVCTIPPLLTAGVFKVGSGDIFSAFFAWAWMIEGLGPLESAEVANQATAYYVTTRTLPIPDTFIADNVEYGTRHAPMSPRENQQVYLAGPFFTMAQRWLIEEARFYLREAGLRVFSPIHDVGMGNAQMVAAKDLQGLRESDVIYAILSGLDPGTLFELGYARALGKRVIVYVQNEKAEDLKMVVGSGCTAHNDFASSIYLAVWAARFAA